MEFLDALTFSIFFLMGFIIVFTGILKFIIEIFKIDGK